MLQIVCVDSGNYCGRGHEYVTKLYDMVHRNLPDRFPGKFIVFSDYLSDYGSGIEVAPLPGNLNGWWNKLWLFKSGLFEPGSRILFFDLDIVITGKLDDIATYDGKFAILSDYYHPTQVQSAVMAWEAGAVDFIWDDYEAAGFPEVDGGDQEWIAAALEQRRFKPDLLQRKFPGAFASYKGDHCQSGPPKGVSVCVFHGHPRPHEVTDGWVPWVWKIGGGTSAMLESICNTESNRLLENVRRSCVLDLPWLEMRHATDEPIVIAGGGPSLSQCFTEIPDDAPILALNAASFWLQRKRPAARISQVILDARPEMIGMVDRNAEAHYFASQCHPGLFEIAGINPVLFHPNIAGIQNALGKTDKPVHLIGGGSTVGLQAMVIAYVLGYRRMHLIGMDSSYLEDEGHAYPQPLNDGERIIEVTVAGKTFKAAPWMAQQADEFQVVSSQLANMGCEIIVHGSGLLPTVAKEIQRQNILAENGVIEPDGSGAHLRGAALLEKLGEIKDPIGAEIGVFQGAMSRRLLAYRNDLRLIMVDSWAVHFPENTYAETGDFHAHLDAFQQEISYRNAVDSIGFARDRAMILRQNSTDAAKTVLDRSLDFVFIDADHSEAGCWADIHAWLPKLKPGALLCGHDYANSNFPQFGVTQAVNRFATENDYRIELGPNFTWFIRLPKMMGVASAA